jgi:hypothetical protein
MFFVVFIGLCFSKGQFWLLRAPRRLGVQRAQKRQQIRLPHCVRARFWLLLSMGRRDWRGAETIGVWERISSRPAEPRASRASGNSRGSNGRFLLADFIGCCSC